MGRAGAVQVHLTCVMPECRHGMAASIAKRKIGQPLGQTLAGKHVLVFGMGSIAEELLPRWALNWPGPQDAELRDCNRAAQASATGIFLFGSAQRN